MADVCRLVNDMYYFDCANLFIFRDQSKSVTLGNRRNCSSTVPGWVSENILLGIE